MNRCNRCMLQSLEKVARNAGGLLVITTRIEPTPEAEVDVLGGYDIGILYPSSPTPVFASWLMSLPDRCAC